MRKPPPGIDKYEKFTIEGVIVGWLTTDHDNDSERRNLYEDDVAVVQADDGHTFVRWLGSGWEQVDPPVNILAGKVAVVGTRISFTTTWDEQVEYTRIARGL